jgi:hypothetical protein
MEKDKLPITCPLCGRKNDFLIESLKEGAIWKCPVCLVELKLHGHMWRDIESEIQAHTTL